MRLLTLFVLLCVPLLGCNRQINELPSDEEIVAFVAPYLNRTVQVDLSNEFFILGNFEFGYETITDAILYLGFPRGNTSYFAILNLTPDANKEVLKQQLKLQFNDIKLSREQEYLTGATKYAIIEKQDKLLIIMHENLDTFHTISNYLNNLGK